MYQEGMGIINELLNKLKEQKSSEHDYNILTVLGVDDKEVRLCRLIGDLLDPNGAHGLGCMPLERFLDQLRILGRFKGDLNNAYVVLEDVIDSNRRVDIAIYIGNSVIPIEAKIYAGDQDSQLFDYYNYYSNSGKEIDKIYYLTPLVKEPSENSRESLKKTQYANISFDKTIKDWLGSILEKGIEDIRVKSLIEQFIEVILKMCKEANITEIVGKYIDFDNTEKKKNFEALYSLFNNSGDILKMLRQEYAKKYIVLSDKYEYKENDIKPGSYSSQVIFRITKNDDPEAKIWLCYEDAGFYIMTEPKSNSENKLALNECNGWKNEKTCSWKRIYTNSNRRITLQSFHFDAINISTMLNEIK